LGLSEIIPELKTIIQKAFLKRLTGSGNATLAQVIDYSL
jgi:hypothetical protein